MDCGVTAGQLRARLAEQQEDGVAIAVLDCIDDRQLQLIGEAIFDMPLLSGSSAWGMVMPQIWRERGMWTPSPSERVPARAPGGKGFLIVSGSCSEATRRQNAWATQQGFPNFYLDVVGLPQGEPVASELIAQVTDALAAGRICLLSTTSGREVALPLGISSVEAGERIAQAIAQAVALIFKRCVPAGLVIAGGETSSTLMRTLGLGGLRIGPNIEPGVPVCVALARPELGVVLKSGNFGSVDFYGRAIAAIRALPTSIESESKR